MPFPPLSIRTTKKLIWTRDGRKIILSHNMVAIFCTTPNALRNILTVHSFEIFELLCMPVGFLCYFNHSDFLCYVLTSFVVHCSVAHPYLLADNRHYPFYIWRKVITAHWSMKYLLVPLYVYSWFSVFSILG